MPGWRHSHSGRSSDASSTSSAFQAAVESDEDGDGDDIRLVMEGDERGVEQAWPNCITKIVTGCLLHPKLVNGIHMCVEAADNCEHRVSTVCKRCGNAVGSVVDRALIKLGLRKRKRVAPKIEYKLGGGEAVCKTAHGIGDGDIHDFYYLEKAKIGEGSSGCVFKAINRATFWTRAVKALSNKHASHIDAFLHEIHVMKELDHPNIVKLFDTYEDFDFIYMVMEYCSGPELADRIVHQGVFTEKQTAMIMQQLCRALCYMHGHGFMHRDLKPENLMLFSDGPIETNILKIIDFGLAIEIQEDARILEKCGGAYYVAPQVMAGDYDKKADMWTVGVLMYMLLAGYPPFMGKNDMEVLGEVRLGNFFFNAVDWRGISDGARDVIRGLLTMEESKRMTAEQVLATPWLNELVPRLERVPLQNTIIQSLRDFRPYNFLRKEALEVIANHLTECQLKAQRDSFNALDYEGDGTLGFEEFRDGLLRSGLKTLPDDLKEILDELDSDGSGKVEYTEFLAATVDKKYLDEEVIWSAFRFFDANGDGKISQKEVYQKINGRIDDPEDYVTIDDVVALFRVLDESDDGFIDFHEFYAMMRIKVKPTNDLDFLKEFDAMGSTKSDGGQPATIGARMVF